MQKPIIPTLHCTFSYDNRLGGSVHAALNVCQYLARDGQPVELAGTHSSADDTAYLAEKYPELLCRKFKRSFPQRYSNSEEMISWMRNNVRRFDLVELHGVFVFSTMRAAQVCQGARVPYFVRPHGSLDPFDLKKHALLKQIVGPVAVRWLLKHSAGVVCTSALEAERLATYGAFPTRFVVPLPVPTIDGQGNRSDFRERHGIPSDAQVVLFMSRVDYKKGLDFLIPALARLKREFPKLWFVLAGTGTSDFVARVHSWIDQSEIRAFTKEIGFVSGKDKADAFAAANIFALPSLNENFGIVVIEAMECGLPVLISSEVYICQDIAGAGAGVICSHELNSVIKALRSMLDGSVDLRLMGERARQLVRTRYQPEAATEALIKAYESVAKSSKDLDLCPGR
jgi:glycosyltransferase involved in cell wall biosynthesis